jgi:hypothetical protein
MELADTTLTTSPTTLQVVIIFLTVLNCLVVGLRLYTRQFLGQTIKIDDWFAVAGYVFVLALTIFFSIGTRRVQGFTLPSTNKY